MYLMTKNIDWRYKLNLKSGILQQYERCHRNMTVQSLRMTRKRFGSSLRPKIINYSDLPGYVDRPQYYPEFFVTEILSTHWYHFCNM